MSKKKYSFLKTRFKQILETKKFTGKVFGDAKKAVKSTNSEYKTWITQAREKIKNPALSNYNLGIEFFEKAEISDAVMRFKMSLMMNPDLIDANLWLAKAHIAKGEYDKAEENLNKYLSKKEKTNEIEYYLSLVPNNDKIIYPNHDLIKKYFARLGQFFDINYCNSFRYAGINTILNKVTARFPDKNANIQILELGCFTGLLGQRIKQSFFKASISGLDFTPESIEICKEVKNVFKPEDIREDKNIIDLTEEVSKSINLNSYDKLIAKDFADYAENSSDKYDLIVCRGFLHYQTDINDFFSRAAKLLKKKGTLIFYVNQKYDTKLTNKIITEYSFPYFLRIRHHSKTTVEKSASKNGFVVDLVEEFQVEPNINSDLYILDKK